ncbi:VOC family protein [Bosea sp. (in: a-proteobacteria)]|uniref:VOC family protein n=1 Tax=Bosea sp. (in: a-proteobacteria) TaxID=1871050 RepID=UPI003B3A1A01
MEQRLTLVTLGVGDLERSRRFYAGLGWLEIEPRQETVAFFQLNGIGLSLFPRAELAKDAGVTDGQASFSGITLAHNLRSEGEVDRLFAEMVGAGARAVKNPQKVFWGGYSGYVSDPDGHLWELAYNPFFPLDSAGNVSLSA